MSSDEFFSETTHLPARKQSTEFSGEASRINRHRGTWSFISRYFFLGQIFVAQQFLSGAAHAQAGDDSLGDSREAPGSEHSANANAASPLPGAAGGDEGGAVAGQDSKAASTMAGKLPPGADQPIADGEGASFQKAALHAGGTVGDGSHNISRDAGDAIANNAHPGEGGAADPGHPGGACGDHTCDPHIDVGTGIIDVGIGLGHGISLDLDVAGLINLDLHLPIDLGAVTEPVVGLVEDVFGVVENVVGDTTSLLASVTNTATSVLDTTLTVVASTVGGLGATVGTTVAHVTDAVDGVGDALGNTLGGAVGSLGTSLAGVTGALGGVTASPGVISFLSNTVSGVANPDSLFDQGKYTDLNIAMQSGIDTALEPVADTVQSTVHSLADLLLGDTKDADSIDIGPDHGHGFIASLIPDATKGGLADLFA
jgi:hypothetical protein